MVIALSHRYCCAAINHSLSRMLSSCCNQPVIVWNKVLLFVINPPPLCVAMIFLWMDYESMHHTGALKNVCKQPVCHCHTVSDSIMLQLCALVHII